MSGGVMLVAACTAPADHLTNGADMEYVPEARSKGSAAGHDAGAGDGASTATTTGSELTSPTSTSTTPAPPPPPAVDAGPVAFTTAEIQTLFDNRCQGCHTTNSSAGLNVQPDFTVNTVGVNSTQVPAMQRIMKGSHTQSYLWHKLNGDQANVGGTGNRMPNGGTAFTAAELAKLAAWIDAL